MTREDRPHWSMALYADNPIVMVGDTVRLRGEAHWKDGLGGDVFVPAETLGTVLALTDSSGGVGIHFQGFSHPVYSLFPMARHKPGQSRYSDNFTLISRIAYDPRNELPRDRLQEEAEARISDVQRPLAKHAQHPPRQVQLGGKKSLGIPGAQGRGQRMPGGPARSPRIEEVP